MAPLGRDMHAAHDMSAVTCARCEDGFEAKAKERSRSKSLFYLPTLIVDHLGLSSVKAFVILSCDCDLPNNCHGFQHIFLLLIPKKHQLLFCYVLVIFQ